MNRRLFKVPKLIVAKLIVAKLLVTGQEVLSLVRSVGRTLCRGTAHDRQKSHPAVLKRAKSAGKQPPELPIEGTQCHLIFIWVVYVGL